MSIQDGLVGTMAGYIENLLMFNEITACQQGRGRELVRLFNEQVGRPERNDKKWLREPQNNISESQALAIESEIKQIMGEMK